MFLRNCWGLQKILFEVLVIMRVRREAKKLHFFFLFSEVLVEADVVSRMHAAFSDRVDISGVTRCSSEKWPKPLQKCQKPMFLIGPKGIVNNRLGRQGKQEEIPFKIVKRIILDVK